MALSVNNDNILFLVSPLTRCYGIERSGIGFHSRADSMHDDILVVLGIPLLRREDVLFLPSKELAYFVVPQAPHKRPCQRHVLRRDRLIKQQGGGTVGGRERETEREYIRAFPPTTHGSWRDSG